MTPEQAKQLKYGDKILVEAEVQSVCADGDVEFLYPFRLSNGREEIAAANVIPQRVSLMQGTPKYDPCRLFKKGDKVMLRKWCGRNPVIYGMNLFQLGEVLNVDEDENPNEEGVILVINAVYKQSIHACFLELVTPVEEREPYSVGESSDYFSVDKDDEELSLYWKDKHPHAKEAAEAE